MRAFVLTTGRSGSTTFARACSHITNYTSAHETKPGHVHGRLDFPDDHIEVDHRLTWFLGTMDKVYGDDPVYVYLRRDPEATAQSWARRKNRGTLAKAFGPAVYYWPKGMPDDVDSLDVMRVMVQTVNDNIEMFLKDKTKVVTVHLEKPDDFAYFWEMIGAEGSFFAAFDEFKTQYNSSRSK